MEKSTVRKFGLEVIYILCAALLVILLPLIVVLLTPVYLFRCCVQVAAWLWIPQPHSMLSMSNPLMAADDIYTKPKNVIIFYLLAEGVWDQNFMDGWLSKLVYTKVEFYNTALPSSK